MPPKTKLKQTKLEKYREPLVAYMTCGRNIAKAAEQCGISGVTANSWIRDMHKLGVKSIINKYKEGAGGR